MNNNWKKMFFSLNFEPTAKSLFFFELTSWHGRRFRSKPAPKSDGEKNYLNFGAGSKIYTDYINADFYTYVPYSFKNLAKNILCYIPRKIKSLNKEDANKQWMLDFRYKHKCPDSWWDGVFSEHVFEHLKPNESMLALKELYRTMKPGAHIRLIVPSLDKYVSYYSGDENPDFAHFGNGAVAVRCLTQSWGHFCTYNAELLCSLCKEAGFIDVEESSFGNSRDAFLLKDTDDRAWESLYVEATKPK